MKKASPLTRVSLLLAVFFGADKLLGVLRTVIIGRQFGLSEELDVFNAANNLPDLLFALISGGALAIAFIPVLTETLTKEGRDSAWRLFSQVANLAFIVTAVLAVLVGIFAGPLVRGQLGIAPGFTADQQTLTVQLMRMNLVSTLIFSISGLVMAGLQANKHFLLPAIAPILYDVGQIFGALVLAPEQGLQIGAITLPAFGLGIQGLVYGVIIGAALHLLIQVPGLMRFKFRWTPKINFRDRAFRKVLRLMGPRLVSMVFIQLIFLARDNLASRLVVGSVTALSYGWWIQQVPETLIGTAIATALLPTLAEHVAEKDRISFRDTIQRSLRVMIALSLPVGMILSLGSLPLIQTAFGFSLESSQMILWATQAYLVGLLGHSIVEVGVRSFYADQNARVPMITSGIGLAIYIGLAILLMRPLQAGGIALANSLSYSLQALILLLVLNKELTAHFQFGGTFLRSAAAAILGGLVTVLVTRLLPLPVPALLQAVGGMAFGAVAAAWPIWREIKTLAHL
ncbi:MAG: murein biosynthesis integral membrane protein MurJ [Chloroflexota bacterium]|nr:murein biosynthesis integral membrane protein MurJ [Chloroflexota bacterium]